ncbi:MAG TPA: histidine kinase [Flavobacteriaceae bacterium]|nr:histidine kinase [Flavobacteriaceae bacterium]
MRNFLSVLLVISFLPGISQIPTVSEFSTANVLPHNTVRGLFLDHEGTLWIGTDNGLVGKFNNQFSYYFEEDGLPANNIWSITEDRHNVLWAGSYGEGIAYKKGNRFLRPEGEKPLVHKEITTLFSHRDYLYVGTSDGFSIVNINSKEVAYSFRLPGKYQLRVHSFFDLNNHIYVITYNTGIFKISMQNDTFKVERVNGKAPFYGATVSDGKLFLSSKNELLSLPLDQLEQHHFDYKRYNSPTVFWDYIETPKNERFGAGWGIFEKTGGLYKITDEARFEKMEYVPSEQVTSLAYNSEFDQLFAGTLDQGLFQINLASPVRFYKSPHHKTLAITFFGNTSARLFNDGAEIGDRIYGNIFFKEKQEKYIQENQHALPRYEDFFYEINYNTPASSIVYYSIKKSDTHIWINTNIGLYKFNRDGNFESYLPLHTLEFDFTPDNRLLETNPYHGVRIYDNEKPLSYTYFPEESAATPTDVVGTLRTKEKTYLLSVFKGLFSYDTRFRSYLDDRIWGEKKLRHITPYKQGIAVSQEFGDIFIIDDSNGFTITDTIRRKEIRGHTIACLNAYRDWLIIITERGMTFWNDDKKIIVDHEQGLNRPIYHSEIYQDTLFLGTDGGEFRVDLQGLLHAQNYLHSVFVSDFFVNGKSTSFGSEKLMLRAGQNNLRFVIGANAHPFPEKLSFQYKLHEDSEWQDLKNQELSVAFLEPRKYDLYLRVYDATTGMELVQKTMEFKIRPPVYLQWWFMQLTATGFIITVMLIYRYKKRSEQKRARKEIAFNRQIEKLKTDALLAQMNPHFIFNALNSIQHLVVLGENDKAASYLVKFAKLVRTNLNNAERTYTSLKEELDYLKIYCDIENERHGNRINIRFDIDPTVDPFEEKLPTMVLQPFIENAFVHAFPPSVEDPELTLTIAPGEAGTIQYTIRDNGVGSNKKSGKSSGTSRGISLIKERLQFLNYNAENAINIAHTSDGTTVSLIL